MKKITTIIIITFWSFNSFAQTINTPIWEVPTVDECGWGSPTIGPDGTIYLGDDLGILLAVNPDGTTKWSSTFSSSVAGGSPVLNADGSKLYIITTGSPGVVNCVDPITGSPIWQYTIPSPSHITTTPEVGQQIGGGVIGTPGLSYDENTLYFGTGNWLECTPCDADIYDDRFVALDISSNIPSIKWELKGTVEDPVQNLNRVSFWASPSIASDGTMYVGNFNGFLYHIQDNGSSYTVLHKKNFDINPPMPTEQSVENELAPEMWGACAIDADGTVYVQSNDGFGWALNPDLTVKWWFPFYFYDAEESTEVLFDNFTSPAITPNGQVILASEAGYIHGVDKNTGAEVWKWPNTTNPPRNWWRSATVDANGVFIIGNESQSGKYYAIDSNIGELVWETDTLGTAAGAFPAIADDGTIYLHGGDAGNLYALSGNAPLANTAWPKFNQNNFNTNRRDVSIPLSVSVDGATDVKFQNSEIELYPNPASNGQFTIEVQDLNLKTSFQLIDVFGKKILKRTFIGSKAIIQTKDLPKGMYLIEVLSGKKKSIQKIIIE